MEFKGIVVGIRGRGPFFCTLHDGGRSLEFESAQFLHMGESYRVEGEESGGKIEAKTIEKIPDMYKEVEEKLCKSVKLEDAEPFDETMGKLAPALSAIDRKLKAASVLGRHITVKFHGDADGVCSALSLKKFLRASYFQQNSAIYSVGDAVRDMERMTQQFRPLLLLLDFGSGEDSEEGLRLAKAAGIEILSIDHHPPHPGSVLCFSLTANPWDVIGEDEEGSDYPAGLLCSILSSMAGSDCGNLGKIACAGDKSGIMQLSEEEKDKALVLDFVATYSGFGNGIDFYGEVLSNPELFNSILLQANSKLEEADRMIRAALKSSPAGRAQVYSLNLDSIAEKKEFPSRGKVTGRAFELVNGDKPIAVIGYSKRILVFRFNNAAASSGIRADIVVKEMKDTFADFVDNGGGHARAAALKVKEDFENAAIGEIIKIISRL